MDSARRADLVRIFQAGLDAVAPDRALLRHLRVQGDSLLVQGDSLRVQGENLADDARYDLSAGRVLVLGGGRLASAASPARVLTLLVSDVVGDRLDVIASGPTAPDPSTFGDCLKVIDTFGVTERLPRAAMERLRAGARGDFSETPKPGDPVFDRVRNRLVATNRQALDAAAREAELLGYQCCVLSDTLQGEADEVAVQLAAEAQKAATSDRRPLCLLAGGETTVSVRGTGLGGRNQEMALAANLALAGDDRVTALFGGTDGSDGPTDAAGGFACGEGRQAMREAGVDPEAELQNNNSHAALDRANLLLRTGPTRTNVMDIAILLVGNVA